MIYVRLSAVARPEVQRSDSHTLSSLPRAGYPAGRDDLATAARQHTRKSTCRMLLSQSFPGCLNNLRLAEFAKNFGQNVSSSMVRTKYSRLRIRFAFFWSSVKN